MMVRFLLLRHIIDNGSLRVGIVAGLTDARLHRASETMHERPEHPWTLDELAQTAAMPPAREWLLLNR